MSTGGPDPNRSTGADADRDVASGNLGDPAGSRLGMPSWLIVLLVVIIAGAFLAVAIF